MFRSYTRKCEQFDGKSQSRFQYSLSFKPICNSLIKYLFLNADFSNGDEPRDNIQKLTECLEKLPNLLVDMATEDDDTKGSSMSDYYFPYS